MAIGFNGDLTTEILLRLPVKSILRFKTVSKLWLSIASSPRFRQIHASRIVNPTGFFCRKDFAPSPNDLAPSPKLEFFPLDSQILPNTFPFFDYPINLISSSGGLLLLLSRHCQSFVLQLKRVRDYFVCNPTTNEFKQLAAVPQLIRDAILVSETLAFDPCKSPHYKIVFLFKYHELDKEFQIIIYSSETQTFSSPLATTLDNFRFVGVYCNDAIHWISFKEFCCIVYYFDLKRECMKESPLPSNLFEFSHYFGESQGHLHLVTSAEPPEISLLEVHELKSDYSGWSLKYKVNLASMPNTFPKGEMYLAISNGQFAVYSIFVDKGDEENMIMVFLVYGVFVAAYLKYKLYIRLMRDDLHLSMLGSDYYHDLLINGWPVAHQYIETLACVDPPKTQVTCSNKIKTALRKRRRFG